MHIDIEHDENCEVQVNFSECADPAIRVQKSALFVGDTNVTVVIEPVDIFYGSNVTIKMNDNCDNCLERFYIPSMKPTGISKHSLIYLWQLHISFLQNTNLLQKDV